MDKREGLIPRSSAAGNFIIFQKDMTCNSFFIRLKCYYLEKAGTQLHSNCWAGR